MAKLTITVNVDSTKAYSEIANLEKRLSGLTNKTITLNVDTKGVQSINSAAEAGKKLIAVRTSTENITKKNIASENELGAAAQSAGKKSVDALNNTNSAAKKTGDTLTSLAGKVLKWAAATTLIYGPLRAIGEALDTMQAVDDTLVEVRKTTDFTASQMKALEEQAYETASAYGVAADEYLSAVAEFARAGYEEQSAALAELSLKTQIVGDVSAETANQFLLSVDAAYKLQGNISELAKVLDGANEIDNKYATSIEKIAEGLGIVAPVAAQAEISIEEMTASIGTITAVTQRSGSEAARAYRALILNILGDTKTEIDEGVTWTTGEIAGLKEVIKEYAPEAYKAAQATGELINPMEAIGGLAQAMEDGLLTEAKLMEMVSDIGGKLRTSQLLALIQNWEMYESMLSDYENAFGSADREMENAMNSWSRKMEVLQNTWTQFVSNLVETDAIKAGIDVVTRAIEILDTTAGRTAITLTALLAAATLLGKGFQALGGTMAGKAVISIIDYTKAVIAAKNGSEAAASAVVHMGKTISSLKVAGAVAGIIALISGVVALSDALYTDFDEATEAVANTQSQIAEIETEYQGLVAKGDALTQAEENRKQLLEAQLELLKEQLALDYQQQYDKWSGNQYTDFNDAYFDAPVEDRQGVPLRITGNEAAIRNMTEGYEELAEQYEKGSISQAEYLTGLREIIAAEGEDIELLKEWQAAGVDLNELDLKRISTYEDLVNITAEVAEKEEEAAKATDGATSSIAEQIDDLTSLQDELAATDKAIEAYNEGMEGGEKGDRFKQYADIYNDFLEAYNSGLTGSNAYKEGIKAFMPEELLDSLQYDWEKAGKLLANDFWQAAFSSEGEDYGAAFVNSLYEISDANGELYDSNGDLVASFEEVDGSLVASFKDIEELAEMLGTTPEFIYAVIDAWDIFSSDGVVNTEKLIDVISTFDGVVRELESGIKEIDATAFVDKMREMNASVTTEELWNMIHALEAADDVVLVNVPESIADVGTKAEETKGDIENLDETEAEPEIGADKSEWDTAYETVLNNIRTLNNTPVVIKIKTSGSLPLGWAHAEGTDSAFGGPALVNDGNGPELIAANGRAYIAGGGNPTVTNLPKGAKVYTAEETREILKGLRLNGSIPAFAGGTGPMSGPLFNPSTGGYGGSSSSSRPSYSGGSSSSSSSSSSSDISEELEEKYDAMRDELDALLQDLEHQIFHMEIKGNMATEMVNMYRRMQDELHKLAEEYRAQGLDENSDYIQELQEQWQDYEDEITKIAEDLWDELDDAIGKQLEKAGEIKDAEIAAIDAQIESLRQTAEKEDELLEIEEKRLAIAEAQEALSKAQAERTIRVYNSEKNQWEWVADAEQVQNAQEQLEEAEKNYEEYLKDKELNDKIAALEERKEAIEAQYDAYEQMWDAITESVAEPTRDISDILSDISQNGLPAMKDAVNSVTNLLMQLGNYSLGVAGDETGGSLIGGNGGLAGSRDYSKDTTDYAALMLAAPDIQTFKYFADERLKKIQAQGIDLGAQGWETNNELYKMWESSRKKYDSGGILYGLGGIKATPQPEIVLPPDITKTLLEPQSGTAFKDRLSELAFLYGARGGNGYGDGKMFTNNSSVTNNGGPYYFGNIEISEQDAQTLTIADLARQARSLALYSKGY